ncbi:MAG TPA: PA14 domain-containing protein [Planctomycetota bacterium]
MRFAAVLAVCFALSVSALAGQDNDPHATGCRPPTLEEEARYNARATTAKNIRFNNLAWQRINEHRQAKGLMPAAAPADVAAIGDEIVSDGSTSAPGAGTTTQAPGALPVFVDNTKLACFPPVSSQGGLGSCACFSSTYYQMTHMTGLARGFDNKASSTYRFSPKWTYNMVNGGSDSGSWMYDAHQLMMDTGCATWNEFPYDGSDYRGWCLDGNVWRNAINYRLNQMGSIGAVDTTGLDQLKQLLVNGYVVTFATDVYGWKFYNVKDNPSATEDDAYVGWSACYYVQSGQGGGHAMTIAGYNDSIWIDVNNNGVQDPGETGALLIVNSWGTGWGHSGMCWLAYDALKAISAVTGAPADREAAFWSNAIYWITAKTSYTPSMVGMFTVNHGNRSEMRLQVGKSDTTKTTPTTTWGPSGYGLYYDGGAYAFDGSTTACDATFCLDLTNLSPDANLLKRYYVAMADSTNDATTGTIKSFKVIDVAAGNVVKYAANVPQTANNNTAYAYTDYTFNSATLPAVSIAAPTPNASEAGPSSGKFTLTRTGATTNALAVTVSIGGSATNGSDYLTLATGYTIPAGSATLDIVVTPIDDTTIESSETVILTVTPTAQYNAALPDSATVTITSNDTYANGPGHGITREWWTGISGTAVTDLTGNPAYPDSPTGTETVATFFEAPTNWADNYGQRMHGYFIPPATGQYTFYIASDDNSELWLSTDNTPANIVKIAAVTSWTNSRAWTTYASQKSAPISLTAGNRYYIRALQKEGGGGDNLAVGMDLPGGVSEKPIPYHRLDPWDGGQTVPAAPSNLAAGAASSSQINLTWTDNATTEAGFKLERKTGSGGTWAQIAAPAANATSFGDTGLAAATTYFYRIRATNAVGDSAYSNEASATTGDVAPAAPTNLAATAASSTQINLTWADNSNNENGFKLERKMGSGGTYAQIAAPAANATSFGDSGLTPATTYFYRVRATNAAGDSGYSNEASATTADVAPAAPSNLAAIAPSPTQVNLTWVDNASNETGFKLERKTGSGGAYAQINAPAANATSFGDTSASPNTTYYYRIKATNAIGDSGYSNEINITTPVYGNGNGLVGYYFDNMDLTGLRLMRIDTTVNFDWGTGSPDAAIGPDTFSVRWVGQVRPMYSETYTFYTVSDDGVRLWVNGQQLVNNWTDHGPTENSGTIALSANQNYDVTMEYYENGGGASAKLLWSSSSQSKVAIPQSQLYSANQAPEIVTAAACSASPVIGTTANLSVLATDESGEPGLTYTWAATATPTGASPLFSANGSNAAKNTTVTFDKAGSYTFLVTIKDSGNLSTTSSVSVNVNQTLTAIAVSPATALLPLNGSQQFSAAASDQFAAPMTAAFTWSATGAGTIAASGLFTAGNAPGSATVTATSGTVTGTAGVTISNTGPTVKTAAFATPSPVNGTTTALSVLGSDDGGEPNLTYTWVATAAPAGASPIFSGNGTNAAKNTTATFDKAGSYTFQVTIKDSGNLSVTSSVSVTVNQTLTTIVVSPASITLPLNGAQQFSAAASDQFAAPMTAAFTWSATGAGTIATSGLFTAGNAPGSATVTATSGTVIGIAGVTISNTGPTVKTAAFATPSPVTGTTTALSVLGSDDGGDANLTYTWVATAAPTGASPAFSANGTNAAKNTTVTFNKAGNYTFQVTIKDSGNLSTTSSVSVTVNQTLTSIAVSPASVTLPPSSSLQFSASGSDQFGVSLSGSYTWSCAGVGSINSTGLYSVGNNSRGSATITAAAGGISGTASISIRKRAAPVLASAPSVSSGDLIVGQPVQFTAATVAPDGNAVICTWDAGDGSEPVIGDTFSHVYTAPGTYTVTFTAGDGADGEVTTSTFSVTVSPGSSDSTDGGAAQPDTPLPMTLKGVKLMTNSARAGSDTLQLKAVLPGPVAARLAGAIISIDVGGIEHTFALDAHGRCRGARASASVRIDKKSKAWLVSIRLTGGSWSTLWADINGGGSSSVPVPVSLTVNTLHYAATKQVQVKSRASITQALGK